MIMKRILTFIAIMAISLMGSEALAQKVIKDAAGKIYIDVTDMSEGTWSSNSLNSPHDENSPLNTLYKRFEVAKNEVEGNWSERSSKCPAGWRLPTMRELQLIYLYRTPLTMAGMSDFAHASRYMWAGTVNSNDATQGWAIRFSDGTFGPQGEAVRGMRCVREVAD